MADFWQNQVLERLQAGVYPVFLVHDPDRLLDDEFVHEKLLASGFEMLHCDDQVGFRRKFETRFRDRWANGQLLNLLIISHSIRAARQAFPFDVLAMGPMATIRLSDIFPDLDMKVLLAVDSSKWQDLYEANTHRPTRKSLSAAETSDFILRHAYGLALETIREPSDVLILLLNLHYRQHQLTGPVASYAAKQLASWESETGWPVGSLLGDRDAFYAFLQRQWERYLDQLSRSESPSADSSPADGEELGEMPRFDKLRVYMDTLFLERILKPVAHQNADQLAKQAEWIALGLKIDPETDSVRRLRKLFDSCKVPSDSASHTEWLHFAGSWAALTDAFFETSLVSDNDREQYDALRNRIDEVFETWILAKYASLHNLPPSDPVMVHHVLPFLRRRLSSTDGRIALVVVDGLSLAQLCVLRRHLDVSGDTIVSEERHLFAWIPTLTSVSRVALMAGKIPGRTGNSKELGSTSREERLWREFWLENRIPIEAILYQKSIMASSIAPLRTKLADDRVRVVGLILNEVDSMMHGEQLGARGMHSHVKQWMNQQTLVKLVHLLAQEQFEVWITSDHGNTEAIGVGSPSEGVLAEQRGQRVRVYENSEFRSRFASQYPNSIEWKDVGLPDGFQCLLAGRRDAFTEINKKIVTHGGCSIDELIVPLVRLEGKNNDA